MNATSTPAGSRAPADPRELMRAALIPISDGPARAYTYRASAHLAVVSSGLALILLAGLHAAAWLQVPEVDWFAPGPVRAAVDAGVLAAIVLVLAAVQIAARRFPDPGSVVELGVTKSHVLQARDGSSPALVVLARSTHLRCPSGEHTWLRGPHLVRVDLAVADQAGRDAVDRVLAGLRPGAPVSVRRWVEGEWMFVALAAKGAELTVRARAR